MPHGMWYTHTKCTKCGHEEAFLDEVRYRKGKTVQAMDFCSPTECACPDETNLKVTKCVYADTGEVRC